MLLLLRVTLSAARHLVLTLSAGLWLFTCRLSCNYVAISWNVSSLCAVFICEYVQICKRKTKLCKPNVCRSVQPPSFMHFILFVFYYGVCSWMELWIWTRGAASVQPSGSWGGGRLRTWRQLWLARDFDPHASISRRTRRISTGEAAHTDTQMSVLMTVY